MILQITARRTLASAIGKRLKIKDQTTCCLIDQGMQTLSLYNSTLFPSSKSPLSYSIIIHIYNIPMSQPPPPRLPPSPNDLTDALLNTYIENFLDIADFRTIENGKALLELIRLSPDHPKLKPAIRKVVGLFGCQAPAGRVCALQFLKEALEAGSLFTVECLEKSVLVHFAQIIEYRAPVRSIQRGSTYFCREFDKNISDEEMINLVKLSSTFFRMVHECLYVWGALYFPGSAFDRLRAKMEKKVAFPEFPKEFKFYSETKVNHFKERCADLIRKVDEKSVGGAESGSAVERKAESTGKEKERNGSNSPRSIKKTKQPIKEQSSRQLKEPAKQSVSHPPKQQARAANEQSVKDQQQIDKQQEKAAQDNPPSSKRTKRHKPKKSKSSKKQFIENIKEEPDKISDNNSSRLRKKNSFVEVPFDLEKQMPPLRHTQSTELHRLNQAKSRDLPSKAATFIKTIQQHDESDGGRYSMDEAMSKESEISEIMYQHNNKEMQSPRSQYSLKDKQDKQHMPIKREDSQQLQPSITARGKDTKKQTKAITKREQGQQRRPKQQEQRQVMVQDIQQASLTKKQHSFKLPLSQLKGRMEVAAQPSKHQSSERRRHDKDREKKATARKKFVSSQEQSMKEHRQEQMNQQIPTAVKNFNENSSLEYESNAKNEVKMTKHQNRVAAEQRQQRNDGPALPPKAKQPSSQTSKEAPVQPPMPVKSSKPIKLKSNSNLKTVFESSGYKVVQVPNKNNEQTGNKQGIKTHHQQKQPLQSALPLVQKKNGRNASEVPPVIKQAKKASIFETVQADTIETINELTSLTRKSDTKPSSPAKVQLYEAPEQPSSKVTIRRQQMPQLPKDNQEATHRQAKTPARDQRSISLQKRPLRKGTEEQHIQHHQNQTILHNSSRIQEEYHSMEVHQQHPRPIRRNSTLSSRFRHFKEVNLFIQPKKTIPASTSDPLMPPQPPPDQDQKVNFIEELNKIRTAIIQREENLNLTIMSLRSEMPPDRKSSEQNKIETATQTKLRHKSKGKFERKNKYKLFDDLSRSQENASLINLPPPLPKEAPQPSKPAQMPPAAMARKPSTVQKQQLKPNTLLYALYKRKYSNV